MGRLTITVNGERWEVYPSGHPTTYGRDEFGLVFQAGTGTERRRRFTRQLTDLFHVSQPAWTAPESAYGVG